MSSLHSREWISVSFPSGMANFYWYQPKNHTNYKSQNTGKLVISHKNERACVEPVSKENWEILHKEKNEMRKGIIAAFISTGWGKRIPLTNTIQVLIDQLTPKIVTTSLRLLSYYLTRSKNKAPTKISRLDKCIQDEYNIIGAAAAVKKWNSSLQKNKIEEIFTEQIITEIDIFQAKNTDIKFKQSFQTFNIRVPDTNIVTRMHNSRNRIDILPIGKEM